MRRARENGFRRCVSAVVSVLAACASGPRFRDAAPAAAIREVAVPKPRETEFLRIRYQLDAWGIGRFARLFRTPRRPAGDVNAIDEVPDSSWFTNRAPSPEEVRRGQLTDAEDVYDFADWGIVGGRPGGRAVGLTAVDACGRRHFLKFDRAGYPELRTAASAITARLFWALGYDVPEDYVFVLRRENLRLAPGATLTDTLGRKRAMTEADVDAALAHAHRAPDGTLRALASRLVPGDPVGSAPAWGVRDDDPNDRVPHEHRRTLRALYVFGSWLDHTDVKPDNTFDAWEDGVVRHYLVDFDSALGVEATIGRADTGFAYAFDTDEVFRSLATLGWHRPPWETLQTPGLRGVGRFESEAYRPESWKPTQPYAPFDHRTDADAFWAVRNAMRLGAEHVRAAVAAGRLSDPDSRRYLEEALLARRAKLARVFLSRVSPLDAFATDAGNLRFRDVEDALGLDPPARYAYRVRDGEGRTIARGEVASPTIPLSAEPSYRAIEIRVRRGDSARPPVQVHIGPSGRVIGVVRD